MTFIENNQMKCFGFDMNYFLFFFLQNYEIASDVVDDNKSHHDKLQIPSV